MLAPPMSLRIFVVATIPGVASSSEVKELPRCPSSSPASSSSAAATAGSRSRSRSTTSPTSRSSIPSDAFLHNVASWRALVAPEWIERIFFPYDRLLAPRPLRPRPGRRRRRPARDARLRRRARARLPRARDRLRVPVPGEVRRAGPTRAAQAELRAAHGALAGADRVLIVGAGPAGLELAGEIRARSSRDKRRDGRRRGAGHPDGPVRPGAARRSCARQLDALGVELVLGSPLRALPDVPPADRGDVPSPRRAATELRRRHLVPRVRRRRRTPTTCAATLAEPRRRTATCGSTSTCASPGTTASSRSATSPPPTARSPASPAPRRTCRRQPRGRHHGRRRGDALRGLAAGHRPPARPGGRRGTAPGRRRHRGRGDVAEVKGRHMLVDGFDALFDVALPVG